MMRSRGDDLQKHETLLETGYIMAQHIDKTFLFKKKRGGGHLCGPLVQCFSDFKTMEAFYKIRLEKKISFEV
jgi:hypothetical protein